MAARGKWAQGIEPRNFTWVLQGKLAVCERPGGYGQNHRKVRRQEEIIWLREQGFTLVVSVAVSPHNLHNYDEMGMPWRHRPFHRHGDQEAYLARLFPELRHLQPALAALIAAAGSKDKDLPLAFMSSGGYDNTAGVVALARSEANLRVVQRVAYPNIINVENIGDVDDPPTQFFSNETASRIQAAQAERLKSLQARSSLPVFKTGMGSLLLARQGTGSLGALADELQNIQGVTVPTAFPDEFTGLNDNAFGGDFRGLLQQAQLALHAFHAGVAVAANLNIGGFDTHSDHDNSQTRQMMKLLKGFAYIWKLAAELGIDNNLYVVVGSDFGRTPFYNEGDGKDHWNVTSMVVAGPQIEGNRVIGATDDGFKPMRVDPKDVNKVLPDDDKNGVRIEPHHIHRELRRLAGLQGTPLDNEWGLAGDSLPLFA